MKTITVIIICLCSSLLFGQNYSLDELQKMHSAQDAEAFAMNPDSVYVLTLSEVDTIPSNIDQFKNLHSLSLFLCRNMNLDRELGKLKNNKKLIQLEIFVNDFKKFPEVILEFTHLKSLTLAGMQFDTVPEAIKNIKNLEELILGHPFCGGCHIMKLPSSLIELNKLRVLRLWGNTDLKTDKNFCKLPNLKELDLSNLIYNLNDIISDFPNLENLDLTGTELKSLDGIEKLKYLRTLAITYCDSLANLGKEFSRHDSLEELDIYINKNLFSLNEFTKISKLPNLKKLKITLNNECQGRLPIPSSGFQKLNTLAFTALPDTKMDDLIKCISHIKSLQFLTLDDFKDKILSEDLFSLRQLKGLELQNMPLISIPKSIKKLELTSLKVWNIPLTDLPKELCEIEGLNYVYLGNTKLDPENAVIKKLLEKKVIVEIIK